ncbi:hypothetical protein F5146DRAFT_1199558 [Armillaria mellea]|nr:hypothetical protein F5146DRAFT_1199558 [Armillaria mellea]
MKVPPHATAHIYDSSGPSQTQHYLVRDGRILHILVPKWPIFDQNKSETEIENERAEYSIDLIETLINSIDFGGSSTAFLNTMVGLHALWRRKLDLNFKVLGHLIRDNEVVGIVMEPNGGRYVESYDRALVYKTFQELQRNKLVFVWENFDWCNLKTADGKVRFHTRNLQSIKDISRECDPERLARSREKHWSILESMLQSLGRPLLLDIQFSTDYHSNIIWSKHRRAITRKKRLPLSSKCDEDKDIERGEDDDVPFVSVGAVTLSRTSRRRQERQYEPYWPSNTLYTSAWSDVSDATSTTETGLSTSPGVFAHFTVV